MARGVDIPHVMKLGCSLSPRKHPASSYVHVVAQCDRLTTPLQSLFLLRRPSRSLSINTVGQLWHAMVHRRSASGPFSSPKKQRLFEPEAAFSMVGIVVGR
jgi:hypothetical protein